jgi:hypothetical protein
LTSSVNNTNPVASAPTWFGSRWFSIAASASASDTAPRMPPHSITSLYLLSTGSAIPVRLSIGIRP